MAATNAAKNRAIRQDSLREMLSKKCTVEQVLRNVKKMEEQGKEMESVELQALRAATDTRVKLLNKYIPDLKSMELVGDGGGPIEVDQDWRVEFINAPSES